MSLFDNSGFVRSGILPSSRGPLTDNQVPQFTIAVRVGNTTEEHTVNGYPAAVDRAKFERDRCPEAVVTITPGW